MRRRSAILLFSALAPSAAYIAGCFDNSTSGGNGSDAGFPIVDSGIPFDVSFTDSGAPDVALDSLPDAAITISNTLVDLGPTDCGTNTTKTYAIANPGPVPVTYSATITAPFTINSPAMTSGTLAPGATLNVTIGVSVPATSTAGTAITGTLTVTTDVPGYTSVAVPLQVTPQGGSLSLSPTLIGLGQQQVGTTTNPALPFTLTNTGNEAVTVAFGSPSDAEFGLIGSGSIAPGGTLAGAAATFAPTSTGAKSATAAINVTGAVCGTSSVTSLSLSGTGATPAVNIGPSPLNFNTVSCGKSASPQTVTIQNTGPTSITYTAALGLGDASSPFALSSESGTVAANSSATITVTPNVIAPPASVIPGAFNDTVTINTSAAGSTPFSIPLQESASGAILTVNMPNAAFGTVPPAPATEPFTVTNSGNADADGLAVVTAGAGFSGAITPPNVATANGGSAQGTVTFSASVNNAFTGTINVTSTSPVCNTLPAVNLSATSAIPVITPTGTLNVSSTCGTAGPQGAQSTLTLDNTGNALATVTVLAPPPGAAYIVISPTSPISIPAGGSGSIVVQGIPGANSVGGATVVDNLTFTTNEPVNSTHTWPVNELAHGANIVVAALGTATCNGDETFTITNTGDMSATVNGPLFGASCTYYQFDSDPFSSSGNLLAAFPGPSNSISGSFSGNRVDSFVSGNSCSGCVGQVGVDSISFTTNSGDPVCQDPGSVPVTYDSVNACSSGSCDFCCGG